MARNDSGLRWSEVTIDNGDDAKDALDRISFPQDLFDRLAATAVPRSSIVISDEPLSRETNYRTEFVTVLNNQPQGGFITRKPTVVDPDLVASSDSGNFGGFNFFFQRNAAPPQPVNALPSSGRAASIIRRASTNRGSRAGGAKARRDFVRRAKRTL